MPNRTLPEEKKDLAVSLLRAGKSYREVAEALDISVGSVHNICMEPREGLDPLVAEIKSRLSARYYLLADHVLGWIIDDNLRGASLKEKAIAAAILTDKARMLDTRGRMRAAPAENEQNEQAPPPETSRN